MMRNSGSAHFAFVAFLMMLFVVLYVWQNISMMKIRMDCREQVKKERELFKEHDRLLYEIERLRRIDLVEEIALGRGMERLSPRNMLVVIAAKKGQ